MILLLSFEPAKRADSIALIDLPEYGCAEFSAENKGLKLKILENQILTGLKTFLA